MKRGSTCEECGDPFTLAAEGRPPISITTVTTDSHVRSLFGVRFCPKCRAEYVSRCPECGEFFDTNRAARRGSRVDDYERRHMVVSLRDGAGRIFVGGIDVPRGVYCHHCWSGVSPHQQMIRYGMPVRPGCRGADERWLCVACREEGPAWILELEHGNELAYLLIVGWDDYGLFPSESEALRFLRDDDRRRSFAAKARRQPLRAYPNHPDEFELGFLLSCEAGFDVTPDDDYADGGHCGFLVDEGFTYIPHNGSVCRLTEKSRAILAEIRARGVLDENGRLQRFESRKPAPDRTPRTSS